MGVCPLRQRRVLDLGDVGVALAEDEAISESRQFREDTGPCQACPEFRVTARVLTPEGARDDLAVKLARRLGERGDVEEQTGHHHIEIRVDDLGHRR